MKVGERTRRARRAEHNYLSQRDGRNGRTKHDKNFGIGGDSIRMRDYGFARVMDGRVCS